MPTNEFPELDNKLNSAIDLLLGEQSNTSGAQKKIADDGSEAIIVPFPEAVTQAGSAAALLQPAPWAQSSLPLLKNLAACSPIGREVATHLEALEEKLLNLEWGVSEEIIRAILENLSEIPKLLPAPSPAPQVIELMNRVLAPLSEDPHALNQRKLQFLFEARQTLWAVCAQALNCPVQNPPNVDLLEDQYFLLISPSTSLSGAMEHTEAKVGFLSKPLIHWEHLGTNSISLDQYRTIHDNLVKNVSYLTGLLQNFKKRQKGLGNLISDLFLWYLGQSKKFWLSYRTPQSLFSRLAFWKRSSLPADNAEVHQAQVRLGNYLENIEEVNHDISQSLDTVSIKLKELGKWVQELQQMILAEVLLFKVADRIFAIPSKDKIKNIKSASLDQGAVDSVGNIERYIKVDIREILALETESINPAPEAMIVQNMNISFAILAEEIYGKEIVLFTRLEQAAGGPFLAGIAVMEGIPCYLLELEQIMQSAI
jgi:hypothetical protein